MSEPRFFMFTFTGGEYHVFENPACTEVMEPRLREFERVFLAECAGRYYRTIEGVVIFPVVGETDLPPMEKLPIGPWRLRKIRGKMKLFMFCIFPHSVWIDKTSKQIRAGIADFMIDCKDAARSWLDKRKELLDPDKFEHDFARALDKYRRIEG